TLGAQTVTITTAATGTQDATHVRADDALSALTAKLQTIAVTEFGAGSTVAWSDVNHKLTITAGVNSNNITVSGSANALTNLGVTAGTYKPTNAAFASGSVTVGLGTASTTINFGTGAGQVGNKRDYIAALNAITGISATASGGTSAVGTITIANSNTTDYRSTLTITGSSNTVLQTNL